MFEERRELREDLRFARFWDARVQEPGHPLALLAKTNPELVEVVRQVARNAFASGVFFAEGEAAEKSHKAGNRQ